MGVKQILLINVSGPDRPGITTTVTAILARFGVNILDIGQSVIHDHLSLGLLAEVPHQQECTSLLDDVIASLQALDVQVQYEAVNEDSYERWVGQQGKPQHIVTLLARLITAEHIAKVTEITTAQGLNIDHITRLSGRIALADLGGPGNLSKACVEFSIRGEGENIVEYRQSLLELSAQLNIDLAYQEETVYRRHRRLVVFDMDSTLIEGEVIDELAHEAGVGDAVAAITARAMAGEMDFQTSFRERVAMLEGLDAGVLDKIAERLKLTEGAEHLVETLKSLGYKTAILSGGFTFFCERIRERLGIDYMYANHLDIANGVVTGLVRGEIVDGQRKADLLVELAGRENVKLEQTVAVGDGANDLLMLSIAGLGIAYRAKPLVRARAKQAISNIGLDGILYLMGIRDRDTV